ncbi:hypothetical protein CSUI_008944, partial [Cystoisospora suis]
MHAPFCNFLRNSPLLNSSRSFPYKSRPVFAAAREGSAWLQAPGHLIPSHAPPMSPVVATSVRTGRPAAVPLSLWPGLRRNQSTTSAVIWIRQSCVLIPCDSLTTELPV